MTLNHGSRFTTGTCPKRWRTRAAGRCATLRTASRSARRWCTTPCGTASAPERRSTSPGARIFVDPLLRGRYPDDLRQDVVAVSDLEFVRDGDERAIAA